MLKHICMRIYILAQSPAIAYMTRVISLSEEAYKALKKLKRNDESFSDVIIRLIRG
ncbi:MAG: antitoxin VapB family protein [Candidatus Bathyarchaeia archaeon]